MLGKYNLILHMILAIHSLSKKIVSSTLDSRLSSFIIYKNFNKTNKQLFLMGI